MSDEQTSDSVPFINMAAGVGIKLIDTEADNPDTLRKLRQILTDIQQEHTEEDADSEEETEKALTVYHCYQCAVIFAHDPVGYLNCLNTCIP